MVSKNLFVCLSVTNFDLNYLRTGEIELAKIFYRISLSKSHIPNFFFLAGSRYGLGRGPKSQPFCQVYKFKYKVVGLGARAVFVCPFLTE